MGNITRRDFVRTLGIGAAALSLPGCASSLSQIINNQPVNKQPNILFLFTDDQRYNTLSAMNCPEVKTPNLDRLVQNGTTFTHSYIQGSTSGAVCVCSRAGLLTGRGLFASMDGSQNPYKMQAKGLALWPETFRQSGYSTFGTGKWHNGTRSYARSFTDGGNIFFGGMWRHYSVPVMDFRPAGDYPPMDDIFKLHAKLWADTTPTTKHSSELFSDSAVEFLNKQTGERPFFAYVSYMAPHDPRTAPKEYLDMYPTENISLPENFMPEHPFDNGELHIRDEELAPFPRTPEKIKEEIGAYYAMITHVDAEIGRVLKALEDSGQADNTIIVFTGDNGLAVGQHGLMGKQNMYEHSVRVPMVFSGPGIKKNKTIDSLVYLHDLFPTTCAMAGLGIPQTVEGTSILPLLTGKKTEVRDSVYSAYRGFQRMVRTNNWKLIMHNVDGVITTQLFDIENDPWELNNLSDKPAQASRVKKMTALLKRQCLENYDPVDVSTPDWKRIPGEPQAPLRNGSFVLLGGNAKLFGEKINFMSSWEAIGYWRKDEIEWNLKGARSGDYHVELCYSAIDGGRAYTIQADDCKVNALTETTGDGKFGIFISQKIGKIKLPGGDTTLKIIPNKSNKGGDLMSLRRVRLLPI